MMSSEVTSAAMKEVELQREEEEEELELGLSLGANISCCSSSRKHHYCCRILTAKDFPAPAPESSSSSSSSSGINRAPQPPSQVVGWPPIRAFRMNSLVSLHSKPNNNASDVGADNRKKKKNRGHGHTACRFVKVNKDGDPIGRKVDLGAHASYESLAVALEFMFRKPTAPSPSPSPSPSANNVNASKLLLGGTSDFALTYKDKDGDWMLVGDVPYGMFLDTVKRLRIMRTSDASGLTPRFQLSTSVS